MTDHVADMEQRIRALQPDESFIVQAPAGSGKTELLIQRYLRLLAVVDAPEEIVAITFTRKAAAEMRGRIINALERVADSVIPEDEADRQTHELAAAAMAKNRDQGWQLEASPGRLRIQTIDSLCGALTRQMPILSRFGAQPETVEDARELYEQAAVETLAELESGAGWSDAIAVLLDHLDNDLPRVRDMLAAMLARRDQWLRHIARGIRRDELESGLRHVVMAGLQQTRDAVPPVFHTELAALIAYAADNLEQEERESVVRSCRGLEELPPAAADVLEQWRGIATLLLKTDGGWRQAPNARDGFPAAGGKGDKERRAAMKDRFKALIAHLSEDEALRRHIQAIKSLPPATYTDTEWQVVQALCELLLLADAQLRVLFSERNQIDFSGITQAAIEALGDDENPTDLALHLDYRIRHILVDEFQDISTNQYELLRKLTAGWESGDGRTLFLVGDPMQSIYRFREAEVGLFLNTREEQRLGQVAVTPLDITVNFRSGAGIVEWVNETFACILPADADVGRGAVAHSAAEAYHDHAVPQPVTLHALVGRDDDREAAMVLQQIQAARENNPAGSIAVLVRSRPHLHQIVPVLKQAGLRYRAVEIEPLGTQPAIQDLMALTRALHHFADRVAWLAILRAPWCGLSLSDLLVLAGNARHATIWECLQDEGRMNRLSNQGRMRLPEVRDILQRVLAQRQRQSVSCRVESAWLSLGGPATLRDETDLENSRTFFDMLAEFDAGGDLRDRDGFMARVEALFAAPDVHADENLQIMTIHKAKGLEFDTVIVPGLARGSRSDDTQLLLWSESPHRDHQDLLLAPVKEAGETESPVYGFLKSLEKGKRSFEDGRLLYVAATRARKQLHLIGSAGVREENGETVLATPRSDSLLAQLWPVVEAQYQSGLEQSQAAITNTAAEAAPAPAQTLRRLVTGWQLPPPPGPAPWRTERHEETLSDEETSIEFEWAGETVRHIGTLVHRCIQWIAGDGVGNQDEKRIDTKRGYYRRELQRLGVPEKELDDAIESVIAALKGLIRDERGRWILNPEHQEARDEYAVSGVYDGGLVNIIIDRTFIDQNGTRWIIDYKTSPHRGGDMDAFLDREQERYRAQLEKYAAVMNNMDNRPVMLGLYYPLLQGWREWSME